MSSKQLPLRAGMIGLSASAITAWASAAHLPGLLSTTGRSKIAIKALLNSSVDAAKAAVEAYKLPSDTKTYGTPKDLAADPEIDLVICNTRVDKHYETILPSVRAGKDVYVEWPIAAKAEHMDELVDAARKSGSRVAVGLQRRWAPPILKMRELLDGGKGKLGKILSADVRAYGGTNDRVVLPPGLKYFAQREVGGNPIVIGFGHAFDMVLSVVGDLTPSTVHAKAQIQRPNITIRDPSTKKTVENMTSDVPDLLTFHGTLAPSPISAPNATLSFLFRRGQPYPGTPTLTWTINCEHGEVQLISHTALHMVVPPSEPQVTIKIHWFDTNEVEDVQWTWPESQLDLPLMARDVAECLYAFAEGREEGNRWAGLESARARAAMIEGFLNSQ